MTYSPDLLVVVGARPNFMKAASVLDAARAAGLTAVLIHTGQHYDGDLSQVFFEDLGLPEPDIFLGVGSGTHTAQTTRIMVEFEAELAKIRPKVVVVVGDVNSTLACALVAVKEHVPVAHVEAGLRCYDPWMPEEINRRLTDHVSSALFTTSRDADENLLREGIDGTKIHFVGNTMIDTLLRFRQAAAERNAAAALGLDGRPYGVLTLHRPANVDALEQLENVLGAVMAVARQHPIVFPVHPRTRARLAGTRLAAELEAATGLVQVDPQGYLDFMSLVEGASVVLTDSGGIQEETTVLGVRCLTLRESTERPITVTEGSNVVVGTDPQRILEESELAFAAPKAVARRPELWDGHAGERIVEVLRRGLTSAATQHPGYERRASRAG
jgi:UDP-N-acetylglucosamine 2-epimerase (non-hydrolysing)